MARAVTELSCGSHGQCNDCQGTKINRSTPVWGTHPDEFGPVLIVTCICAKCGFSWEEVFAGTRMRTLDPNLPFFYMSTFEDS